MVSRLAFGEGHAETEQLRDVEVHLAGARSAVLELDSVTEIG
jgi:hypothetical protein